MVEGKVVGVVDTADIADDVVADGADEAVDERLKKVMAVKLVVVSSHHELPRCGVSRFWLAQSIMIPLSVLSASISPAH